MPGLPNTLAGDGHKSHLLRKSSRQSKYAKSLNQNSKWPNYLQEHSSVVVNERHKRVRKACERCSMKKTKCDGEFPCKRCKDDGLICIARSRKRAEFKQFPIEYVEVLENNLYALIATVQRLYTMIRNNKSWDLGEPGMNNRGQPIIHDIASKLGCIRPSPDLPANLPEVAEDLAELQAQLTAACPEVDAEDTASRKLSGSSSSLPYLAYTEKVCSTESGNSVGSKDCNQTLWMQLQPHPGAKANQSATNGSTITPMPLSPLRNSTDDDGPYSSTDSARATFDKDSSIPSWVYTNFQTQSTVFYKALPFPPWSTTDDFLGPTHALDLTEQFLKAHRVSGISDPLLNRLPDRPIDLVEPNLLKEVRLQDGLSLTETTIAPHVLDCDGYDPSSQMDSIMFGKEYESRMGWT